MSSNALIAIALFVVGVGTIFSLNKKKEEDQVYDAPPVPDKSPKEEAQCVLVLGAGTIGSSFTTVFLARGMQVINVDPMVSREVLKKRIDEAWPYLVARGLTSAEEPTLDSLATYASIAEAIKESGSKVTFVQECTWENVESKQKVLAELDRLLDPSILISSSTSYIPWKLFASSCQHKHRIMVGHPTIPHIGAFMEVYGISPEWAQYCKEWYRAAAFDVIVMKKTIHGHVFNSILRANMEVGTSLVRDGICSVEDVDLAMRYFGRGTYSGHLFISMLCAVGGDRGVEGGIQLVERIMNDAVFIILYSGMKEKGVPDFLAQPAGKLLGKLLLKILPDYPEEYLPVARKFEAELTQNGKIPPTTALFNARSQSYKDLPMEVGNDRYRDAVPKLT